MKKISKLKLVAICLFLILLIILFMSSNAINNAYDVYFMNKWYNIFSKNSSFEELIKTHRDIKYIKSNIPPNRKWCYIYKGPIIPFSSGHKKIIYKNEYGQIYAFWKGEESISSDRIFWPVQDAEISVYEEEPITFDQELIFQLKKKGYIPYIFANEKVLH